ncbi:glycosyltransferase [Thermotoga sp. Ku-13t]|uniref:glycosyltransferase n=1 Tax=Thermotoga sp. Ku-13t TaxID=1755813 RepID=UPI0013EC5FA8|nr:glycosyltransferase [Thermotoga sp. Ku-13t]KAF2957877.1 glycosyltransferase [Thermotoga sp. Ku-13t]
MNYHNDIPEIGSCDIVVGIPSFNNAATIGYVATTAAGGIKKLGLKGLIANSDGGSTDETVDAFLSADTFELPKVSIRYKGIPGKGSAVRALFEIAHRAKARVFIMLDADLRSVQPWWIERMTLPILEERTDYVAPLYLRHKYDGTITNNVCYPLTSALYGVKVRQPIGGDFAVGSSLIETYLKKPERVWESNVARFGIDIWMTTIAINESKKPPVQAALGAKVHDVKDPGKQLQGMFVQVVQTLFELMIEYQNQWRSAEKLIDVEVHGEQPTQGVEEIVVDLAGLKEKAKKILGERSKELAEKLSFRREVLESVVLSGTLGAREWAETVYDFALAYRKERNESLVVDLLPFYFARVADFVERTRDMDSLAAEKLIEEQLHIFMEMKEVFKRRWFVDT